MRQMKMSDGLWAAIRRYRETGALPPPEARGEPGWHVYAALPGAVVAQVGQSLDGRVATPAGDARDISGTAGIRHLHRLRAMADAVVVGVGTVLSDNPSLSVREVPGRSPVRVVIDCNATIPGEAQMLHDGGTQVLLVRAEDAPAGRTYGAQELRLPRGPDGLCPAAILAALAARDLGGVLVEGGARTIARFVEAGLLDRLHVAVAPLIIGSGPAGLRLPPIERLAEAQRPEIVTYDLGGDILFDCRMGPCTATRRAQRRSGDELQIGL